MILLMAQAEFLYGNVFTPAFILYEHLITIQQESLLVWRRAWSMSTWIFIANRYLLATSAVVQATAIHSFVSLVHQKCVVS